MGLTFFATLRSGFWQYVSSGIDMTSKVKDMVEMHCGFSSSYFSPGNLGNRKRWRAQPHVESPAVIGFVRHQFLRRAATFLGDPHGRQGGVRQLALVKLDVSTYRRNRQAVPISHDHPFAAFPIFVLPHHLLPHVAIDMLPPRVSSMAGGWRPASFTGR